MHQPRDHVTNDVRMRVIPSGGLQENHDSRDNRGQNGKWDNPTRARSLIILFSTNFWWVFEHDVIYSEGHCSVVSDLQVFLRAQITATKIIG